MTIKFNVVIQDKMTPALKNKQKELDKLPADAFFIFKGQTPVRTGNARSKTFLQNDTITAAYPYAQRLDDGYSKQAPDGMSRPTEAYIKKRLDTIFRKK
jgi:hypothetical protein